MHSLFDEPRRIPLDGGDVVLHPRPDLPRNADEILALLLDEIPWEQRSVRIQGREIPQPRLVSWHGDASYRYSGLTLAPKPWTPLLDELRACVARITGAKYDSVLLNRYRSGRDSIGMHADDEPELGRNPTIASLSFGAERIFDMRCKDRTGRTVHIPLTHGSLLVMSGETQRNWLHGIAKTQNRPADGERINLTFRLTRSTRN